MVAPLSPAKQPAVPGDQLPTHGVATVLAIALAYTLLSGTAVLLASPSGYATPLYPSAGLALVAALVYPRFAWMGNLLGAFVANAVLSWHLGHADAWHVAVAVGVGAGAALQAFLGALLVNRFVSQPVVLNAPKDILRFCIWGALVACVVSASVATPLLAASGLVPTSAAPRTWVTWWVGDVAGVLIGAPLVFSFIGQPRANWRARRRTLALPLLLAMGLLAAGVWQFGRLDQQRLLADFEGDVDRLASDAQLRLSIPMNALQALHSNALVHSEHSDLDRDALRRAAAWWLAQPQHVQSMGYAQRVTLNEVEAFEAAARAQGDANYRVQDRDQGRARQADAEVVAVRQVEPTLDQSATLGLNVLSVPAARAALEASRDTGQAVASAGFVMPSRSSNGSSIVGSNGNDSSNNIGIALYQALYSGRPFDEANRRAMFRAAAFVTVVPERALAGLMPAARPYLQWCLQDPAPGAALRRLAGPLGCEKTGTDTAQFSAQRTLDLGGRRVSLQVSAPQAALPGRQSEAAGLLALMGLASAALLGGLLLTVTGHSRRTEMAVQLGTAELRREMIERTQAEDALRESEARLRSILDNVPLGVIFLDPSGCFIECNPRLCEMVGRPAMSLRGQPVTEIVHESELGRVQAFRHTLLAAPHQTLTQQLRLRDQPVHNDGASAPRAASVGTSTGSQTTPEILRPLTVRMTATALCDPDGRVLRMVGVLEDINDQLRLAQANTERQKAQAENQAKSEFVSRMSHELRTPLNAMLGFAQLLGLDQEPALTRHQGEWVQQIQRAGWHLLDMINETLDLARIESGHVQLDLVPVALAPLTRACFEMLEGDAAQHNIALHEALQDDHLAVMGDATRLKQVLSNLLSNAVKYNHPGGEVTLIAKRISVPANAIMPTADMLDGDAAPDLAFVEIQVGDTGLGMTPEQLASLFQPYNRLGRESSDIQGTGIGLVICRRLCALMHGSLEVASQADVGTVFTVRLPAVASPSAPQAVASRWLAAAAPYRQKQVHYIEDNLVNVEVMRGVLLQRPQIELDVSMLGLDGLAAVRLRRPDLILLDMQLPDISGMEVLRHLKQDASLASVPVVVVSADATAEHIQEALELGALHYVTKPVEVAPFLQTVDDILDNPGTVW
jgi:PAS domain S-box-containing protein